MELARESLEYLHASGSVVRHLLVQRPTPTQYLPFDFHENLYIPSSRSEDSSSRKTERNRKALWIAVVVFVLLLYFAICYNKAKASLHSIGSATGVIDGNISSKHPILRLVENAESQYQLTNRRQSRTLSEAAAEYRRRYRMPPPPHFDVWYQYAVEHDVQLIDEYDSIYDSLVLFWALEPAKIRRRTVEALGYQQSLMGVSLRDGKIQTVGRGQGKWQKSGTREMIEQFSRWLPDMDIAFNVNDEPRVLIPRGDVDYMRSLAEIAIRSVRSLTSDFIRPHGLNDGQSYEKVSETRFSRLDHQQTWSHSRMSCPIDSPARDLREPPDEKTGLVYGGLEFIFNVSAFTDICLTPSTRYSIGLFNHPNVYSVSHDLVPIFSPSKLSTFHDILYPSTYYYANGTFFDDNIAVSWTEKTPQLFWRGATSGGFSKGGNWKTLLRQAILTKLMYPGEVTLLQKNQSAQNDPWMPKNASGPAITDRYDAKFTEIKQCDKQDCDEMRKFFGKHLHVPQKKAWKYKYLLDMDGNALSGRFYALLKSASLPIKVAYYREWHLERLFPWKHYVPASASTNEYAEILRYFEEEVDGRRIAEAIASQGSDWAGRVLRKKDMEAYMFRLLLEYGRLVDDNRANLGFPS